jgi:hypothetical protein
MINWLLRLCAAANTPNVVKQNLQKLHLQVTEPTSLYWHFSAV